jgi:hypothetical protein
MIRMITVVSILIPIIIFVSDTAVNEKRTVVFSDTQAAVMML